jgi:hypothetical protein
VAFSPDVRKEARDYAKQGRTIQEIVDLLNKKYHGLMTFKHPTVGNWVRDIINARSYEAKPPEYASTIQESLTVQSGHGSFTRPHPNHILFDGPIDIGVLPDTQVKPNVPLDYLACYGRFFASKKPKVILQGGDFADMPSLSFHDQAGSKNYEGKRYKEDILSVHNGMKIFMQPILDEMARTDWKPLFIMTLGNHEHRIDRTIAATPKLDGVMGLPDLEYERWGWEVYPFLVPVVINGMAFAHYFTSGVMGRPITTAQAILTKKHMSCFAFHQQGRDVKHGYRGDGKEITAAILGSAYEHDEDYLNHQTNLHFRGCAMVYGLEDGVVDSLVTCNLKWLKEKYS